MYPQAAETLGRDVMKSVKELLITSHERMIQEVQRCNAASTGASWNDLLFDSGAAEFFKPEINGHKFFRQENNSSSILEFRCICGGICPLLVTIVKVLYWKH